MVVVSQIRRLPGNSRYAADKTRKLTGAAVVTRVGDFLPGWFMNLLLETAGVKGDKI